MCLYTNYSVKFGRILDTSLGVCVKIINLDNHIFPVDT